MAERGKNDEGYGFLFPVPDEKRKENGPRMTGKATLNGQEVEVAAWTKKAKNTGVQYFSLKFQGHELTTGAVPEAADDDIPF